MPPPDEPPLEEFAEALAGERTDAMLAMRSHGWARAHSAWAEPGTWRCFWLGIITLFTGMAYGVTGLPVPNATSGIVPGAGLAAAMSAATPD